MTEVMVAVYDQDLAAEKAVDNPNAARILTSVIRQFVNGPGGRLR